MALHGVIFDMGETLLHYSPPGKTWLDIENTGSGAAYELLSSRGYSLCPRDEALDIAWNHALTVWTHLDEYDVRDLVLAHQMGLVAAQWGAPDLTATQQQALAEAYMSAIQQGVIPLPKVQETLSSLCKRGLRIGLVSNTLWPGDFHLDDLARFGLTPYLDHMIFSADALAWKPHAEIFQMSLNALGLESDEAIFVGDSLYFDVWGAQQAGLKGVWIEQALHWEPPGLEVHPDATITALPDLVDVVDRWNHPAGR